MQVTVPTNTVEEHRATVFINDDGSLSYSGPFTSADSDEKVVHAKQERVVSLLEHKHLFKNLEFIDVLLTNACNLSCAYCYEQHKKDYGKFDTKKVREVWDFLKNINEYFPKYIQFFGGEPLIHKKLILDFMRENREELFAMEGKMLVSITTNGLLLTREFIDEFFSYPSVKMMISLDTIDPKLDHRGIKPDQMKKLLDNIEYVASKVKNHNHLAIRATITRAGAPHLREFWEELYKRGIRHLIFHPLILSLGEGYVEWPKEEWDAFCNNIKDIIRDYPDVENFQVVEGVGAKSKTNCLVGSDELAVDAAGDFSGCYFFTNRKDDISGQMLLGNIFDDKLNLSRYDKFKTAYERMFDHHEECRTCDVKNLCYQCPAGNLASTNTLFRPDGMCKRIVTLYSDINELMIEMKFKRKISGMISAHQEEGDPVFARAMVHLIHYYFEDERSNSDLVVDLVKETGVRSEQLIGYFDHMLDYANRPDTVKDKVMTELSIIQDAMTVDKRDTSTIGLYKKLLASESIPQGVLNSLKGATPSDGLFITLMHFVVMNSSEARKRQ